MNPNRPKRSRHEVMMDVLETISEGDYNITNLMYKTGTNWKVLNEVLLKLEGFELIKTTWRNGYAEAYRESIRATDRGRTVVMEYRRLMQQIAPDEVVFVGEVK